MLEHNVDGGRVRVIYSSDTPKDVRDVLMDLFEKWSWLIPRICDQIRVYFTEADPDDSGEEILAASETSSEYRVGSLYFYAKWWMESPLSRERVFVHEVCHIVVAPLAEQADFIVSKCSEDEVLRAFVEEQNRRVLEGVVTDMEQIMLRRPLTAVQPWPYQ